MGSSFASLQAAHPDIDRTLRYPNHEHKSSSEHTSMTHAQLPSQASSAAVCASPLFFYYIYCWNAQRRHCRSSIITIRVACCPVQMPISGHVALWRLATTSIWAVKAASNCESFCRNSSSRGAATQHGMVTHPDAKHDADGCLHETHQAKPPDACREQTQGMTHQATATDA